MASSRTKRQSPTKAHNGSTRGGAADTTGVIHVYDAATYCGVDAVASSATDGQTPPSSSLLDPQLHGGAASVRSNAGNQNVVVKLRVRDVDAEPSLLGSALDNRAAWPEAYQETSGSMGTLLLESCSISPPGGPPSPQQPRHAQAACWPQSTTTHCFWCCHPFEGAPIGVPYAYEAADDKFHVDGCFCSFECAAAQNFSDRSGGNHDTFERYALLNVMAARAGKADPYVAPAPCRQALDIFGGSMSIEEFRSGSRRHPVVMHAVHLVGKQMQVEEIQDGCALHFNRYIPTAALPPQTAADACGGGDNNGAAQDGIVLKRKKPLNHGKNSICNAITTTQHP